MNIGKEGDYESGYECRWTSRKQRETEAGAAEVLYLSSKIDTDKQGFVGNNVCYAQLIVMALLDG